VSTVDRPQLDIGDPPIIKTATPDEARALVRRELERKPDLMKVWFVRSLGRESLARSSNRGALAGAPQTPPTPDDLAAGKALVAATVDEARKGGVRTAVHATELETARAAVEAGADVLVHSVFDKPVDDAFVELLKRRGVVYIPTLFVRTGYTLVLTGSFTPTPAERRWADPDVLATFEEVKGRPELTSRPRRAADPEPPRPSRGGIPDARAKPGAELDWCLGIRPPDRAPPQRTWEPNATSSTKNQFRADRYFAPLRLVK